MTDNNIQPIQNEALSSQGFVTVNGTVHTLLAGGLEPAKSAAEISSREACAHKLQKEWAEAGKAYLQAAQFHIHGGDRILATRSFRDAAVAFKRIDVQASVNALLQALQILMDEGRLALAAKVENDIAELLEAEGKVSEAVQHYTKCAEYYELEDRPATAASSWLKVAYLTASLGKHDYAACLFESVAENSIPDNLRKFAAPNHFLDAGICHLANGNRVAVRNLLDLCSTTHLHWKNSREYGFLSQLLKAVEEHSQITFSATMQEFSAVCALDQWRTAMLTKAKEAILTLC